MRSRATRGCRLVAANRLTEVFVTTVAASGAKGAVSRIVTSSPVTRPTGTPKCSATSALMPLSPTSTPPSRTAENTSGL